MQVLVYGEWEGSTNNVKSFFTATYSEEEVQKSTSEIRSLSDEVIRFLFVGTLSKGKQPLYVIQHEMPSKMRHVRAGELC